MGVKPVVSCSTSSMVNNATNNQAFDLTHNTLGLFLDIWLAEKKVGERAHS